MREIKFRGVGLSGEWLCGCLVKDNNGAPGIQYYDKNSIFYTFYVRPETVGQYIGLYDSTDKEIYEGDIVRTVDYDHDDESAICVIKYEGLSFCISEVKDGYVWEPDTEVEIIGNIYENPELLKGRESAKVNL